MTGKEFQAFLDLKTDYELSAERTKKDSETTDDIVVKSERLGYAQGMGIAADRLGRLLRALNT